MTTAQSLTIGVQRGPLLSGEHERIKPMQRKRGKLAPIGEVFGGQDGPVKELRETSP